MRPSNKIKRDSFLGGGLAVAALVMISAMSGEGPQWSSPELYVVLLVVWVLTFWLYKIDLDAESKRAVIDGLPRNE
jgi:hypothetical protein